MHMNTFGGKALDLSCFYECDTLPSGFEESFGLHYIEEKLLTNINFTVQWNTVKRITLRTPILIQLTV